jgi:hypothetical protein
VQVAKCRNVAIRAPSIILDCEYNPAGKDGGFAGLPELVPENGIREVLERRNHGNTSIDTIAAVAKSSTFPSASMNRSMRPVILDIEVLEKELRLAVVNHVDMAYVIVGPEMSATGDSGVLCSPYYLLC